jgi:hypothetical protein
MQGKHNSCRDAGLKQIKLANEAFQLLQQIM